MSQNNYPIYTKSYINSVYRVIFPIHNTLQEMVETFGICIIQNLGLFHANVEQHTHYTGRKIVIIWLNTDTLAETTKSIIV